jgi:hypothetical protein
MCSQIITGSKSYIYYCTCVHPSYCVLSCVLHVILCILPRSTSRGLHFWEVVPLDVLLGQLADESHAGGTSSTAQKLHQLLVPSYFPGPEEGVVSCLCSCALHLAYT